MYKFTSNKDYVQDLSFTNGNKTISIGLEEYKQWLNEGNTPEPEFTEEEILAKEIAEATAQAKADKEIALKTLTVTTTSGKTFDGDETARGDMLTAITVSGMLGVTETNWKMADNTFSIVTLAEMQEALILAIQKKGFILGAV